MVKTIENNSVVLIDPDEEPKVVAALMENMNAFISIRTMEIMTTLDKATQYRERKAGRFPLLHNLTLHGKRKAYRIDDLKAYLVNPQNYKS
ncbi:hypothetical protein [Winogradskyella sp. SYSU M77433]|uniref:hypothetical protein n=1 Tax=Winogradskyella sp. SYSU M77433 TaxID=3042722 RepID=UPI0024816036|nr:hypothetical protein [Winogradskyella sp. SYSU M77433]MDH7911357.1 hypothetical protein [Winogradskyella sp. SYSU M77433]